MGDYTKAGSNEFKHVFEDSENLEETSISVLMCAAHVGTIWCNKPEHKCLLCGKLNLTKIKSDLSTLNSSMFVSAMVPIVKELMF